MCSERKGSLTAKGVLEKCLFNSDRGESCCAHHKIRRYTGDNKPGILFIILCPQMTWDKMGESYAQNKICK